MRLFNKSKKEKQKYCQHHAVGDGYFEVNVDKIEFFTSNIFHNPTVFLMIYAASNDIIPNPILSGINHFDLGLLDPKGIIAAAPNQPAERFVNKSESTIRNTGSIFMFTSNVAYFEMEGAVG